MEFEFGNAGVLLPPQGKSVPENAARTEKGTETEREREGAPGVIRACSQVGLKPMCPQTF